MMDERNVSILLMQRVYILSFVHDPPSRRYGRFPDTYENFKEISVTSHVGCSALV